MNSIKQLAAAPDLFFESTPAAKHQTCAILTPMLALAYTSKARASQ